MSTKVLKAAVQIGTIIGTLYTGGLLQVGIILAGATANYFLTRRGYGKAQEGMQVNVVSNEAPLPIIYGLTKVGGAVVETKVDIASTNNEDLWRVVALAVASENGGGIESVEKVWLDDRLAIVSPIFESEPTSTGVQAAFVTDGNTKLHYGLHAGANSPAVDAGLDAAFTSWDTTDKGLGIAYLALRLRYHENVYRGIPNVTALVKGQKVYDPRTSTWAWSDNPALCILDYLTSKRYGVGALYAARDGGSRDEIDEQTFIDAANYCDESVSTPAGSQKRYRCNGWLSTDTTHGENLRALRSSCRGDLVYEGGKFRLLIRKAQAATSFALTEDNIVGGVTDWEFFRGGMAETANKLVATYPDADKDYQPDAVSWPEKDPSNGFVSADNGWENVRDIDLPMTADRYQAQQTAMVLLRESRSDMGIALTAKEEALELRVGDVVPLTHSVPGWSAKPWWVVAMGLTQDFLVRIVLKEYNAADYTLDTLNTKDTPPGTELPDPFTMAPPTAVAALSDATTAVVTQEGEVQPRIKLTWDRADDAFLAYYEVQIKESAGGAEYRSACPDPLKDDVDAFIVGVTVDVDYDIRIRAVNRIGVSSAWVEITDHTVDTKGSNVIKSVWLEDRIQKAEVVPPGGIYLVTAHTDLHYQVKPGVKSLKIVATDGTTPSTSRPNLSTTEGKVASIYAFGSGQDLTVTVTPYDDVDADLGTGEAGDSMVYSAVTGWGVVATGSGGSALGSRIIAGFGIDFEQDDATGDVKAVFRATYGTGAAPTLADGEFYFKVVS